MSNTDVQVSKATLTAQSVSRTGITISNMADLMQAAKLVHESHLAPTGFKTIPQIAVAIETALELGVPYMQGLAYIAVINGRMAIWGRLATALVLRSGLLMDCQETCTNTEDEGLLAVVRLQRKPGIWFEGRFSSADAEAAGLAGKDTYKKHGKDMILWKARHRAYSAGFADVLCGLPFAEEAMDMPPRDAEYTVIDRSENAVNLDEVVGPEKSEGPEKPKEDPTSEPQEAPAEETVATEEPTKEPVEDSWFATEEEVKSDGH